MTGTRTDDRLLQSHMTTAKPQKPQRGDETSSEHSDEPSCRLSFSQTANTAVLILSTTTQILQYKYSILILKYCSTNTQINKALLLLLHKVVLLLLHSVNESDIT